METYSTNNMHLNSFPKKQAALETFLTLINYQKMELQSDSEVHPLKISRSKRAGKETSGGGKKKTIQPSSINVGSAYIESSCRISQ